MNLYLAAMLIGVVAGLRTMVALAAVSWAAHLGVLDLHGTWLAFLGAYAAVPWIFTALAFLELVTDQLPSTPSRMTTGQFAARIISGGLSGAAVGMAGASWPLGAVGGVAGAIVGTFGGANLRHGLALAFHKDRPAALLEDVVAIAGAIVILGLRRA
jgi:uncharacterized membrane protein